VHTLISSDGKWRWDGHQWVSRQTGGEATPETGGEAKPKTSQNAGNVVGVVFLLIVAMIIFIVFASRGNGGSETWYMHWSCGASSQCAQVLGGATGVQTSFSSQADCEGLRQTWAANNTMQLGGTWCSQSSNAGDTGP
jgi:hypothetical protein